MQTDRTAQYDREYAGQPSPWQANESDIEAEATTRRPDTVAGALTPTAYRAVYSDLDSIADALHASGSYDVDILGRVLGMLAISNEDKEALATDLGMAS